MAAQIKNQAIFSVFAIILLLFSGCSPQKPYHKEARLMMGTIVEITCQDKAAIGIAFDEIKKIETIANIFDPTSQISVLNRSGRLKVSPELLDMAKESIKFYKLSRGAFDITIAPIASVWKEKIKAGELNKPQIDYPCADEIKEKLPLAESNEISFDEKESFIKLARPGMSLDLGGIAKGYAVDCAVKKIKSSGIKSALINAGGNIYCLGKRHNKKWNIGIRHPRDPKKIAFNLNLEDKAVATSGDYEQYFFYNNRRYSHIIDPKTGYPVNNGTVSVTIIADTATEADALSTAVFVLGKAEGQLLLKNLGNIESIIIEEADLRKTQSIKCKTQN